MESAVHPEDVERTMSAWLAARSGDRPFEVEGVRLRRHDGSFRSHLGRGFPLRDAAGRVTHWALCGIDLHRAHDAAADAREGELLYKDAFLAMLGHELRNPLGPIRNAAQILGMTGTLDQTGTHALEVIDRQVGLLARLVDDLLDVSRIVAGRLELQRDRCDFAEVVREVVDQYRAEVETSGLHLTAELAAGPFVVHGDRRRLVQVVSNLLHNARKFTPPGGTVTVRLGALEGRATVLTVADTGIGMDPEVLRRAFEAFSQADRSIERTGGGLGLGLALVKGLVDLHDGHVRVSSAGPRKGSQVTVELPLDSAARAGDAAGQGGAAAAHLRVLVIEDNVDAAESLQTVLKLAGHEVQAALSGPSGLAVAERFRPGGRAVRHRAAGHGRLRRRPRPARRPGHRRRAPRRAHRLRAGRGPQARPRRRLRRLPDQAHRLPHAAARDAAPSGPLVAARFPAARPGSSPPLVDRGTPGGIQCRRGGSP